MMRSAMHHLSVSTIRADAVFVSALQRGDHPSAKEVRQAVAAVVEAFGQRGCIERVAQEFGDHPETAVMRMRWARQAARKAFGDLGPASAGARTAAIAGPTPGKVLVPASLLTIGNRGWWPGSVRRGTPEPDGDGVGALRSAG